MRAGATSQSLDRALPDWLLWRPCLKVTRTPDWDGRIYRVLSCTFRIYTTLEL